MMYLVDTNIILELLLDQGRADEAQGFLRAIPPEQLYVSEFTLYSLGIILFRYGKQQVFLDHAGFVADGRYPGGASGSPGYAEYC